MKILSSISGHNFGQLETTVKTISRSLRLILYTIPKQNAPVECIFNTVIVQLCFFLPVTSELGIHIVMQYYLHYLNQARRGKFP